MIERHHYFRLKEPHGTPEGRADIAERTMTALAPLPGVLGVTVATPADDHAAAGWDLTVTVRFSSLEDVETYRADPDHRRFVDEVLGPRIAVKKIWNFTVVDESRTN
ncbi:MAG: Dabb family protein [Candidatus Binatia bacterium]|nr:Dabb family protein [Candidatus Binatia bacterium]